MANPYLAHTLWGMISPKMTINSVEARTANHPPLTSWSRTIGNVSFVMTLPSSRETSTQCLPRWRTAKTFCASSRSFAVPDPAMTWSIVRSWPMNLYCIRQSLRPWEKSTYAKVRPANNPPNRTRRIENPPLIQYRMVADVCSPNSGFDVTRLTTSLTSSLVPHVSTHSLLIWKKLKNLLHSACFGGWVMRSQRWRCHRVPDVLTERRADDETEF